jgi:hypothetical protein
MHKIHELVMAAALLAVSASIAPVVAGHSVSVSLQVGSGYADCDDFEDDVDWDNMIVINNDRIGFWLMLPSGMWVFRCRDMHYDYAYDEWRYGPWWNDYTVSYGCHCHRHAPSAWCPHHGTRFHVYMRRHYPRYHDRYFTRYDGQYYHHRNYHPRSKTVYSHSPDYGPNGTVRSVEHTRTIERDMPVRIDGGDRMHRVESSRPQQVVRTNETVRRTSTVQMNRELNSSGPMMRERSTSRMQPAQGRSNITRIESRSTVRR